MNAAGSNRGALAAARISPLWTSITTTAPPEGSRWIGLQGDALQCAIQQFFGRSLQTRVDRERHVATGHRLGFMKGLLHAAGMIGHLDTDPRLPAQQGFTLLLDARATNVVLITLRVMECLSVLITLRVIKSITRSVMSTWAGRDIQARAPRRYPPDSFGGSGK